MYEMYHVYKLFIMFKNSKGAVSAVATWNLNTTQAPIITVQVAFWLNLIATGCIFFPAATWHPGAQQGNVHNSTAIFQDGTAIYRPAVLQTSHRCFHEGP